MQYPLPTNLGRVKDHDINNYNEYSNVYDKAVGQSFCESLLSSYQDIIHEVYLQSSKHGQIMYYKDIMCGTGLFAHRIKQTYPTINIEGTDLSVGQIAQAMKKYNTISWKQENAVDANIIANKYDMITINFDAINHITDIQDRSKIFRHVYQGLKKGGVFLFDVFTQEGLKNNFAIDAQYGTDRVYYNPGQAGYYETQKDGMIIGNNTVYVEIFEKKGDERIPFRCVIKEISLHENDIKLLLVQAGFEINNIQTKEYTNKDNLFLASTQSYIMRKQH